MMYFKAIFCIKSEVWVNSFGGGVGDLFVWERVAYDCPTVPVLLVEKILLSPLNCFHNLVKNINQPYLWESNLHTHRYTVYCFNSTSLSCNFKVRECVSSNMFLSKIILTTLFPMFFAM